MTLREFVSKFFGIRLNWPLINYSDLDQKQKKIIAVEFLKEKNGKRNNDQIFDEVLSNLN